MLDIVFRGLYGRNEIVFISISSCKMFALRKERNVVWKEGNVLFNDVLNSLFLDI